MAGAEQPASNRAPSLLASAGWSSAGLVLIQLLSFASMWLVSRALGPDAYGRLGLALVFGLYAFQVVQAGLDAFQTRQLAKASREDAAALLAGMVRQKFFSALLVLAAGALTAWLWRHPDERDLIFLGIVDGTLLAFSMPAAFDARARTALYFGFAAVRQVIYFSLAALLIFGVPNALSVEAILIAHAVAIVPQLVLEYAWVRREYGAFDFTHAAAHSAQQFRAALPMGISTGAYQIAAALGAPALEFFGRHGELGALVLSNQLAMAAQSLSIVPSRVVMSKLAAEQTDAEFRSRWIRYVFYFGLLAALISALGFFVGPWLIAKIWGEQFTAAGALFAVDVWRVVGVFAGAVTSAALICQSRLKSLAMAQVIALFYAVVVLIVFVPEYGAIAAVAAVVTARTVLPVVSAILLLMRRKNA